MRRQKQRSREKSHRKQLGAHGNYRQKNQRQRYRKDLDKDTEKNASLPNINREQICPFLTRVYYAINDVNVYAKVEDLPKNRQVILYLWYNTTLKQITDLLRAHLAEVRTKQRFSFSRVYQQNNKLIKKQIGTVMVHKKNNQNGQDRLDKHQFSIGDYIDVSINYK